MTTEDSPSPESRIGGVLVVLGFALVLAGVLVPPVPGNDAVQYEFTATEVRPAEASDDFAFYVWADDVGGGGWAPSDEWTYSEVRLHESIHCASSGGTKCSLLTEGVSQGTISVHRDPKVVDSEPTQYLLVEGQFYPMTGPKEEPPKLLGTEPLSPTETFEAVATDVENASENARKTIEEGKLVSSTDRLGTPTLVADGDSYYAINERQSPKRFGWLRQFGPFLFPIFGAALVFLGQTLRYWKR